MATTANKVFGRAILLVGGQSYPSIAGTATMNTGGVTREPVNGDHGYLGAREVPANGEIQFDIAIRSDTDTSAINNIIDNEIQFQADTGQVWVMRFGALADPVSPTAASGTATLRFIGKPVSQT